MTTKVKPGFQKGKSGNPSGRPKGSKNQATLLAIAAMEGEIGEIVRRIIEAAKMGDMAAARLVIDKLIPAAKDRPISINLPRIIDVAACTDAQAKIMTAVASGDLLANEGETLAGLVEHQRRAIESSEIMKRLEALEALKGGTTR